MGRYKGSGVDRYWTRLTATDFMTKAMTLAAILLLCAFPFVIVLSALTGQSSHVIEDLSKRLGLDPQASQDLDHLFAPAHATTSSISGTAYVFFIFGGIAAIAAIQDLYEKAFGLEPKGLKNLPRQIVAFLLALGVAVLASRVVFPSLSHWGGVVLVAVVALIFNAVTWLLVIRLLVAGRVSWSIIIPSAIATGICWTGMYLVFHFVFTGIITSDFQKYGPIGGVFALMSYFIAIGVVISLGAVFGMFWNERKVSENIGGNLESKSG
jgi:membrane protein